MKKSNVWVWILAAITAVAGIAVAVALFVKRAGKKLQKDLDFDDSIYFEEEDVEPLDSNEPSEEEEDIDSDEMEEKAE
jgi:hypothetical protein